jgi:hypothetical protein
MYQWVIEYTDSNIGLTVECWAYRADDVEKSGDGPPKDFWNVDLLSGLKRFADERPEIDHKALLSRVGMNIAECPLTWPASEKDHINSFQAKRVNIRARGIGAFSVNLPEAWETSGRQPGPWGTP